MLKPFAVVLALGLGLTATVSRARADAPADRPHAAAERAKQVVQGYAFSAFPRWVAANPTIGCPATLEALAAFSAGAPVLDPWGHRYVLLCGPTLPAGARGLAVRSDGPDGKVGTADDVLSWK